MSYKYENFNKDLLVQNWIETEDEDVIRGLKELNEVYAKAEAFDEVIKINKNCWNVDDFDRNIRDVIGTYESEAD